MTYKVLASGSTGNAIYVRSGRDQILIDCGLPVAGLMNRLCPMGVSLGQLSAVLITHEHGDHVAGLRGLRKRTLAKIYATTRTAAAIGGANEIHPGEPFMCGQIRIVPFAVEHDAVEPVGYALECGDRRLIVGLDMARIPEALLCADATDMILESNWDSDVIRYSDYPAPLKERVMRTHLSNEAVCRFVLDMPRTVERLTLCHVSRANNSPQLVRVMAEDAARRRGNGAQVFVS